MLILLGALFALACRFSVRFPGGRFPKVLTVWVVLVAGVELCCVGLNLMGFRTLLIYSLFWPLEFGLALVLGQQLHPLKRTWIMVLCALFMATWVYGMYTVDWHLELVVQSVVTGALMLAGYYLWQLWSLSNTWKGRLIDAPHFWLCLAMILYYAPAGPLVASNNYFAAYSKEFGHLINHLNQALFALQLVLVGIACLRMGRLTAFSVNEGKR